MGESECDAMAFKASREMLTLRHGITCVMKCVTELQVEKVMLAPGEQDRCENSYLVSCTNIAVVVFLRRQILINMLITSGTRVIGVIVPVSPQSAPPA